MRSILTPDLDWDRFLGLAASNNVLPLVFRALSDAGMDLVPQPVATELQERFRANSASNLAFLHELLSILDCLQSHGIRALPLKGPVLTLAVFHKLSDRQFFDLDVLVRKADVLPALDALATLGFHQAEPSLPFSRASFRRTNKHVVLVRDGRDGMLELHWAICEPAFGVPIDFGRLLDRAGTVVYESRAIPNLHPENQLLVLATHGLRHGWAKLKWIADIAALIRVHPELDWERVERDAKRLGAWRTVLLSVSLASDLLATSIPSTVRDAIRKHSSIPPLVGRIQSKVLSANRQAPTPRDTALAGVEAMEMWMKTRERFRDRFRLLAHFALHRLTPNPRDPLFREGAVASSLASGLLRPLRLFRLYGWLVFSHACRKLLNALLRPGAQS